MNEELEGFVHDLMDASGMLREVAASSNQGWEYFEVLSLLVAMLAYMYEGDDEVVLIPRDEKLVIRAYTLIAKANKVIRMKKLITETHMFKVERVGKLLDHLWALVPGGDELKEKTPPITKKDHPAWSQND